MDGDDELWDYHTVTKMEAAQRQLDTAIALWFFDGDAVSIHTLVGAAYQIVHDLNKKRGGADVLFNDEIVPTEHREEFRKNMRRDFAFFKHADRDADAVTIFPPVITMLFFMVCIETLRTIGEKLSAAQMTYSLWVMLKMPELVAPDFRMAGQNAPPEYWAFVRGDQKREFFEKVASDYTLANL